MDRPRDAPGSGALRPQARLRIAGIHAPAEVRALAGPGLEMLGAVPDLDAELRRSAVMLAPVRSGGGMRMKVLHALASGAAVVTTPLGAQGLAEYGAPPLLVAGDADGLARATADLLVDEEARKDLGRQARVFVARHYGPEAYAERLEAFYAEGIALARSGGRNMHCGPLGDRRRRDVQTAPGPCSAWSTRSPRRSRPSPSRR